MMLASALVVNSLPLHYGCASITVTSASSNDLDFAERLVMDALNGRTILYGIVSTP